MTAVRRGRPGYDVESLLTVAVEVFNERGYDGTSMEDLSKRLGIAKSAIYHHVPGKDALLRMAVDRALDGLSDVAAETRLLDGRAIDRLEHLVRGSVAVLQERLPYVTLLLRIRGNTEVERAALARRRQFDRYVASLVREAASDGDLHDGPRPERHRSVALRTGELARRVGAALARRSGRRRLRDGVRRVARVGATCPCRNRNPGRTRSCCRCSCSSRCHRSS